MILVVDDDAAMLDYVCDVLRSDGLPARSASSAAEALEVLEAFAPALVVSDVMMPSMTGFELRRAYVQAHPERDTPFVFLSSFDDAKTIVQGLETGAEDYLVKPVPPEILLVKVRSILRRRRQRAGRSFRGDLTALPLSSLLRFCESKGLTGFLDVFHDGRAITLRFNGGRLDEETAAAHLDELLGLETGAFEIHSCPVDFDDIGELDASPRSRRPAPDAPIGRVSGVRLKDRLLQVQTQLAEGATPYVVTLVTIEGKVAWKRRVACRPDADPAELQELIDREHEQVEHDVETKLAAVGDRVDTRKRDRTNEFHRFCDSGYDLFRSGDYEGAIASWNDALAIDPAASAIAVNLNIAKQKMEAQNR